MNPRLAERIADRAVRAARRLQDAPMWIRSLPARAHRARNPQQWITVIDSTGVTPFWPHEDGELTATQKVKRSAISQMFEDTVVEMYGGATR